MALRLCVIGTGVSGLTALRYLARKPKVFQATAFEQSPSIGGTWVYSDRVGTDKRGLPLHSSMYKHVKTNLPKELMRMEGHPFPKYLPSFIGHEDYLKYLQGFAAIYNLERFMKFNTKVENVEPIKNSSKWNVTVKSFDKNVSQDMEFDAVVVCNGNYCVPFIPEIPGLDGFTGKVLHSHDYRVPTTFSKENVLCIGAMTSGQDISMQLINHANKVYLSSLEKRIRSLPCEIIQVPSISKIEGSTIQLTDNTLLTDVDNILLCTGYNYSFPFLAESCHPNIDNITKKVSPLYQHIIHTEHPTLNFIGLPEDNCVTTCLMVQIKFMMAALDGSMKLPSKQQMYKSSQEYFDKLENNGYGTKYYTRSMSIYNTQWEYYDKLASLAGFEKVPKVFKKLFYEVLKSRYLDVQNYRDRNYEIINDEKFRWEIHA